MELYTVILIALALFSQNKLAETRACNGRSTVIQVRVPQKTNVTVKYPSQIDPVKFVPNPSAADPQCFQCKNSKCQKCNNFNPNARTIPNWRPTSRTNIVIDLKGHHPKNSNADKEIYDTLVYLGDKNTASSVSNSSVKSTDGGAASSSAAASTSNTALIAAFNENENNGGSPGNTENVYLEDTSKSSAIGSASATGGQPEPEKQALPEPKTAADQDNQQPTSQKLNPGQQLTPEKEPAQEQQPPTKPPAPDQPAPDQPAPEQKQAPEQSTSGQQPAPEKAEQPTTDKPAPPSPEPETNKEKEKQSEPLNPTPKAEDAREPEKSVTNEQGTPNTVPASPQDSNSEGAELTTGAKKAEDNTETSSP